MESIARAQARATGNGRTSAENVAYARSARRNWTRAQELAASRKMREGRRRAARERIIARDGDLGDDQIERAIDEEICRQMERARAAALTARRKAREAAERAAAAEAELAELDATGLADCGSDGIDAG